MRTFNPTALPSVLTPNDRVISSNFRLMAQVVNNLQTSVVVTSTGTNSPPIVSPDTIIAAGTGISIAYDSGTNVSTISSLITQYTDALARAAISGTTNQITYSSATGVISLPSAIVTPGSMVVSTTLSANSGAFTTTLTRGGDPVVSTTGLATNALPKASASSALTDSALSDDGSRLSLASRNVSLNGTALSTEAMLYRNVPVAAAIGTTAHRFEAELDVTGGSDSHAHYGALFATEISGTVGGSFGGNHTAVRIGPLTRTSTQTLFSLVGLHIEANPGSWAGAYTALVLDGAANIEGATYIGDTLSVGSLWTVTEPGVMTGFASWVNNQDLTLADTSYKTSHLTLTTSSTTYKPSLGFNFGSTSGATLYLNAVGDMRIRYSDGTDVGVGTTGSGGAISGTTGTLAKFTSPTAVGDSIVSESGTTITVAGALVSTGLITATAGLSMASDTGIQRSVATGLVSVSGGSASNNGGNIIFYGDSHATLAGDVNIRSGATSRLLWDQSAALWTLTGAVAMTATLDLAQQLTFSATTGSGGTGRILRTAAGGLVINGINGSSYSFSIRNHAETDLIRNPQATSALQFPGAAGVTFTGAVTMSSTLDTTGLITAAAGIAITGGSVASGRIVKDAANGIMIQAIAGTSNDFVLRSAAGQALMRNTNGTRNLIFDSSNTSFENGIVAIGASPSSDVIFYVNATSAATTVDQYSVFSRTTFSASATTSGNAGYFQVKTAASVHTMATARGIQIADVSKGAGSTVTTSVGLDIGNITGGGTNNFSIRTGTGIVTFGDMVGIKDSSPSYDLDIAGNARIQGENFLYFGGTGSGDFGASIRWDLTLDGDYLSLTSTDGIILNGNTEIDLDLNVYGTITAGNGINITGPSTFGDITVSGTALLVGVTSSGDLTVSKPSAAATAIVQAITTSNTAGTSSSLRATVAGSSAGDAFTRYSVTGLSDWSTGLDNSDSDAYVISASSAIGTANVFRATSTTVAFPVAVTMSSTLGVTGTSALTGNVGIGGSSSSAIGLNITTSIFDAGATSQYGIVLAAISTSAATSQTIAAAFQAKTAAAAYTTASAMGLQIINAAKGAGSTITTLYGLKIENQTAGSTNYAIHTGTGLVTLGGAVTMSSTLTLTGEATLANELTFSGDRTIRRSVATGYLVISGGSGSANGANLILKGGSNANASDWEFRSGSTTRLTWDESATTLALTGAQTISTTLTVTGVTTATGGVVFAGGGSNLNYYVASSWTAAFVLGYGTTQNTTGTYVRTGNSVTVRLAAFSATSTDIATTTNTGDLPAAIRPASGDRSCPVVVLNNGTREIGFVKVYSTGLIELHRATTAGWTASGSKGLPVDVCFTYDI